MTLIHLLRAIYRRIPLFGDLYVARNELRIIADFLRSIDRTALSHHTVGVMRLLDLELADHPRYGDRQRLLRYAFQACSQNGEDGILHEIFRRVGTTDKYFVEIGVGDGNENNTAFLVSQGWRGLWIDGNSKVLETVVNRGWSNNGYVDAQIAMVSKENASALLENARAPKEFDLLSLDIDQNTYHVWEGLCLFKPRVVVVEYNAAFPADVSWTVPYRADRIWDGSQNFGASLKAFEELGRRLGYNLVGCDFNGVNAFFVRQDLCNEHFASPFTAENHYEPLRYWANVRRGHPSNAFDPPPREVH